jgi:hypothetical protein
MTSEIRVRAADPGGFSFAEGLTIERLRTILQDSHVSFLIGAGTSAPFFELLGDVENVLTSLDDTDDKARLARASVQAYFFEKVLIPNLNLLEGKSADARDLIKSYGRFVATVNRILLKRRSTLLGKQVNIFTTNVDMAFEQALELLEIDCNDGFTGKLRPRLDLGAYSIQRYRQGIRFEYRSEIPVFNLFKIHGSAGWVGDGDEIFFDHRLELVQRVEKAFQDAKPDLLAIAGGADVDADLLRAAALGRSLSAEVVAFTEQYRALQIVNPEKTKFASTVLNKTYYELLRRLANELEKENAALLVHGFSFRDEHLLDLILRAAASNPTLQVIVFCYDRQSHAEMACLFPEERVKNGNILLVRPGEGGDPGHEHKLSLDVVVEEFLTPLLADDVPAADHIIELKLNGMSAGPADAR